MPELLSSLRAPPVPGRFYMVPAVRFVWHDRRAYWPVLGPLHHDKDFFDFPQSHYHLDVRFLGARLSRTGLVSLPWDSKAHGLKTDTEKLAYMATGWPLAHRDDPLPKGMPTLRKMKCHRASYDTPIGRHGLPGSKQIDAMKQRYGSPAEAIRLRDGRVLCPHQKVDLSQFNRDADGIVICPLHGLPVRCGTQGD